MSRLLFTDLDGTLLNKQSHVSSAMRQELQALVGRGHRLVLSSGRPLQSILQVREDEGLNFPGMMIVANNGSQIYDCDSAALIRELRVPFSLVQLIWEEAARRKLHCQTYTHTHIVCARQDRELDFYQEKVHMPAWFTDDIPGALPSEPFKVLLVELKDKSRLESFRLDMLPYINGTLEAIFSSDYYLEFFSCKAGKGNAVRYICDYFGIAVADSFAAGDAENDISMLEAAGTGIAMRNGSDLVKRSATLITTEDNDHDGLIEILRAYF